MWTLALTALVAWTAPPAAPDGPFRELDFDAAIALAKEQEKVVFVDFFTTWCGPCKKLDETTWKDEAVVAWLGEHTVPLKIDAEVEVELAGRFEVKAYPTLLFVKADGTALDRIVGYRSPEQFLEEAADALVGRTAVDRAREAVEDAPNDPMIRQRLGDALAQAGRHEEALREYLWCYDHGLEHLPSYVGVRSSFLLSSILQLSAAYPPARAALVERRDAIGRAFETGPASADGLSDFVSLNQYLDEKGRTLELHARILEKMGDSPVLQEMTLSILSELLEERRYDAILRGIGDLEEWWNRQLAMFESVEDMDDDRGASGFLRGMVLQRAGGLYEALLGATPDATANHPSPDQLEDWILAFDATGRTWARLVQRAVDAEAYDRARSLVRRAEASLTDDKELRRLHRAARKIPEPEESSKSAGT